MSQEFCIFWKKGHKYMNCKYCKTPNQKYCKDKFGELKKEGNICPRCGDSFKHPALSRLDNKTKICGNCGNWEAMQDARFLMDTDIIEKINDRLNFLEIMKYDQRITNIHEFKYFGKIKSILNVKLEKLSKSN